MNLALCRCGIDMTEHADCGDIGLVMPSSGDGEIDHFFIAAGTKYRCEKLVEVDSPKGVYLCPRPAYHEEEGVPCGPLTGSPLWA